MFKQPRLISTVNFDIAKEQQKKELRVYEKLCGFLKLEDLFAVDSVYICAARCASGFYHKADTQTFMKRPWESAYNLCKQVLSEKFRPTYYHTHNIIERGKSRTIKPPTFICKVVQKVLCDYLIRPLLEPKMISTSYASLTRRGTAKMHGSFCPDEAGLSLGNEVSQIPASWFPSEIDHFFKDCLGMPIFRYMDDSLLICKQGEEEKIIQIFQRKSEKLHLSCPDEKIHVYHSKESFAFCKEQYVWDGAGGHYDHLMNQQISQHEMRKILHFEQADDVPKERAERQIRGVLGSIASHPHSYSAIKKLRSEIRP